MKREALSALVLAVALAGFPSVLQAQLNTAEPAGIVPASITLSALLKLHAAAVGKLKPGIAKTSSEASIYKEGDLTGTRTEIASGDDYRDDVVLGPFRSAEGRVHGQEWVQNANGLTHVLSGVHQRDQNDRRAIAHATQKDSGVQLLGAVSNPTSAYVVKVSPPDGRVEYVFYDKSTHLVTRVERAVEDVREVVTYDDFRATDGVTEAWHIHTSDGRPGNDTDEQMQTLQNGVTIDPAKLAVPADARNPVTLGGVPRAALPVSVLNDRIILKTQIGGRKVDFQLDSGASGILLDRSVAEALNIPLYGKLTEATAGTYMASRAVVPEIVIGGVKMQNVAIESAPFHWYASDGTPIAGLMGFDFIDGSVVHIDYVHGTAEAIDPASFTVPAGAIALPIRLDDQVPVITAKIGAALAQKFVFDTGADRSLLFQEFVAAHPGDTVDQGLGEAMMESFPFVEESGGVGGEIPIAPVEVSGLGLSSLQFPRWLFYVTQKAQAFNQEDYDGLIGQDVLRNFDLYLDYHHATIYLVPNERYRTRWGS
jgi:predicted aspartyl protease